jgi:hypothetical protein
MPMPLSAFAVATIDADAMEHQRVALQMFLEIGIHLDEAVCRNVQPHLERMVRLVFGGHPTDEGPPAGCCMDVSLKAISRH